VSKSAGEKRIDVGGQAVIEGVMMRSPKSFAVVCRRQNGDIVIKESAWQPLWSKLRLSRVPGLRGGVVLLESLVNGVSALTFSANQQMIEQVPVAVPANDQPATTTATTATTPATPPPVPGSDTAPAKPKVKVAGGGAVRSLGARAADQPEEPSDWATYGMVALSLVFGLALFVGAPHLAAWGLGTLFGFDTSSFWFHAIDGVIKLIILVSYMALISLMPDIKRVFQYHGAEHKAIYTHEQGLPLTIENARKQTRFHPRCGTSFLLIVIMVSVVLFSAALTYRIADNNVLDHFLKIFIKIPMMFPIAGLAYELIKISGRNWETSRLARMMSTPGLWLQKITTREPDDDQLEIALISIRKTLWREAQGDDALPVGTQGIEVYTSADQINLPLTA